MPRLYSSIQNHSNIFSCFFNQTFGCQAQWILPEYHLRPRTANGETELLACLGITRAVLLRWVPCDINWISLRSFVSQTNGLKLWKCFWKQACSRGHSEVLFYLISTCWQLIFRLCAELTQGPSAWILPRNEHGCEELSFMPELPSYALPACWVKILTAWGSTLRCCSSKSGWGMVDGRLWRSTVNNHC